MILAVTNQKGGAGKTTISCHLAFAAAERGRPVLLIDLDTQGNASSTLTGDHELAYRVGGSEVLFSGTEPVPRTTSHGIDLLHGHQRLDALDATPVADALRCRPLLRELNLRWPTIIIDTPPSLGLRHIAPLLWADRVVIPMEPTSYSLHALGQVLTTLQQIRQTNSALSFRVVINRFLPRSKSHHRYVADLTSRTPILTPYLGLRIAVQEALEQQRPVWRYRTAPKALRQSWHQLMDTLLDVDVA